MLVEFPADDVERARRFWQGLLSVELHARREGEGQGFEARTDGARIGVHARGHKDGRQVRGPGPGDTWSLPYFAVPDMAAAIERVEALGGSIVHPGERWAICKDSEGTPFALAAD